MDYVLDLVAAAQRHALGAQFVGFLGAALALTAASATTAIAVFAFAFTFIFFFAVFESAAIDRGDLILFGRIDFGDAAIVVHIVIGMIAVIMIVVIVVIIAFAGAQRGLFLSVGGFLCQQGLAVLLRDLIVIGVNFAESEEAVTVPAEIDECSLQ